MSMAGHFVKVTIARVARGLSSARAGHLMAGHFRVTLVLRMSECVCVERRGALLRDHLHKVETQIRSAEGLSEEEVSCGNMLAEGGDARGSELD